MFYILQINMKPIKIFKWCNISCNTLDMHVTWACASNRTGKVQVLFVGCLCSRFSTGFTAYIPVLHSSAQPWHAHTYQEGTVPYSPLLSGWASPPDSYLK